MTLGQRIQALRKQQELTQRKLSEKSGVSYSLISAIESDELQPTREAILSLARALRSEDPGELLQLAGYDAAE
jgi:transcriptional regulator with XRE-family HTH domain